MTVNKRKKATRYRGSQTHGGGAKKKRRGAGHRGGRGNAGSGKRADTKKPSIWGIDYFGKRGFTSKSLRPTDTTISIQNLEEMVPKLIAKKLASKEKDVIVIDLPKIGYTKLLSQGNVNSKFHLTVFYASEQAQEKIKSAGGKIVGLLTSSAKGDSEPKDN